METVKQLLHITHDFQHEILVVFICCILVVVAAFIDMWTGIDAARANKERINSHGLRKTAQKITDYLRVLMFGALIDILGQFFAWYSLPYVVMVATFGVLVIEGRSVIENSRKKKSAAGQIIDIVSDIISCATQQDAEKIIELLKAEKEEKKNSK